MFPLYDLEGNVVGFSGRIYNQKSESKYINTKETEIFKKGELLYNYHIAKKEARKEKNIIVFVDKSWTGFSSLNIFLTTTF